MSRLLATRDRFLARRGRQLALSLAATRAVIGAAALLAPGAPATPWVGGEEARRPSVRLFARTLGGRDLALGLGALLAVRRGRPVRGWVEAGGLADAGDSVATLLAWRSLPRRSRLVVLALTLGAATASAALAGVADPG